MLREGPIERRIRRVVARHLGIRTARLGPSVSLRDRLAPEVDAVRALVLAVERRIGVRLPERLLDDVRSYGELVTEAIDAIRQRRTRLEREADAVPAGRARVRSPRGRVVEVSGPFTPYVLEGIRDDARRAGSGAEIAITVTPVATDEQVATLRERLADLERRGVSVRVQRGTDSPLLRTGS